jgi:hypothetical protein
MKRQTVLLVLVLAALLVAAGLAARSKGGGVIARWINAHQANAGH